jgi:hypothetical protein
VHLATPPHACATTRVPGHMAGYEGIASGMQSPQYAMQGCRGYCSLRVTPPAHTVSRLSHGAAFGCREVVCVAASVTVEWLTLVRNDRKYMMGPACACLFCACVLRLSNACPFPCRVLRLSNACPFPCLAMHALYLGRREGMAVCLPCSQFFALPRAAPMQPGEHCLCETRPGTLHKFALAAKLVLTASWRQV